MINGNYKKTLEAVKALHTDEIRSLVFDLLVSDKLKYEEISGMYVNYLELRKDMANSKESLFANCLGAYMQGLAQQKKERPFFQSQAYVLASSRLPVEFAEEYMCERTDELIKKNRGFLK